MNEKTTNKELLISIDKLIKKQQIGRQQLSILLDKLKKSFLNLSKKNKKEAIGLLDLIINM